MSVLVIAAVAMSGCSPSLPGGYTVRHADRGKSWLANPDGTLAHGGLIKDLYRDDRRILVVAYPESGELNGRQPLDDTCYVALLIDSLTHQTRQITVAAAAGQANNMSKVESHDRRCLATS